MKFTVYGHTGNWRWRLRARNGRIIASGESYKRMHDCQNAVELVRYSYEAQIEIARKSTVGPWIQRRNLAKLRRAKGWSG